MSCYVLDNESINTLVRAGLRWGLIKRATADLVGQALIWENIASVTDRYPDVVGRMGDMPGPIGMHPIIRANETEAWINPLRYTYVPRGADEPRLDPAAVLVMIGRFTYQACETPTWEASAAKQFCDNLDRRVRRSL